MRVTRDPESRRGAAALILYTSGTTGRSKGALQSHRNLLALVGCNFFHGTRMRVAAPPPADAPAPTVLVTSPLFHVSGLHNAAVICLAGGIRSVWLTGRFDAAHALATIEAERVTSWGYTQTLLHRLLEHAEVAPRDLSSLRQLGGGAAMRMRVPWKKLQPTSASTLRCDCSAPLLRPVVPLV